jgi:hypothetical protein
VTLTVFRPLLFALYISQQKYRSLQVYLLCSENIAIGRKPEVKLEEPTNQKGIRLLKVSKSKAIPITGREGP